MSWSPGDFTRRKYTIVGDDLEKAGRISVKMFLDGKVIASVQCREPGILAVVSKPNEQGIDVEIVEPGGVRFTDYELPDGTPTTDALAQWQLEALDLA